MSEEASPQMNMEEGDVENQSPTQQQEMESPGGNMEGGDMEGGAEYGCKCDIIT